MVVHLEITLRGVFKCCVEQRGVSEYTTQDMTDGSRMMRLYLSIICLFLPRQIQDNQMFARGGLATHLLYHQALPPTQSQLGSTSEY